ncbi:MAG: hypothetical protein ACLUEK_09480 [Oscillospiraceae bacterium]
MPKGPTSSPVRGGREMSSPELARTLDAVMGAGASKLCFVVGAPSGCTSA